jgi:MFS superfamily sulfate permease-like transporter
VADGRVNRAALAVGLTGIVVILVLKRLWRAIPAVAVAVVIGIAAVAAFDLDQEGVKVIGMLPEGLPGFAFPAVDLADLGALFSGALGIALVAVADTTVLSQSLAAQRGETVDPNQELRALGAANLAAGFFQGFAISSSASRTPVAVSAGARSQLTPLVGAVAIALLLVFAPGLLRDLPLPMLAAIVITAAIGLIEAAEARRLYRVRRSEFVLWLAAFAGVALLGVLVGIFVAILLSLGDFVRRAWRPPRRRPRTRGRPQGLPRHRPPPDPTARRIPGLLLYRFDAPLFFANAGYFRRCVRRLVDDATTPVRWVVVAAEPITDIDTTAADTLRDLLEELRAEGITLAFAELKGPVKDRLRRYGLFDAVGDDRFFPTVGTAVDGYIEAPAPPGSTGRNASPGRTVAGQIWGSAAARHRGIVRSARPPSRRTVAAVERSTGPPFPGSTWCKRSGSSGGPWPRWRRRCWSPPPAAVAEEATGPAPTGPARRRRRAARPWARPSTCAPPSWAGPWSTARGAPCTCSRRIPPAGPPATAPAPAPGRRT